MQKEEQLTPLHAETPQGGVGSLAGTEPLQSLPLELRERVAGFQRDEETEYRMYRMLAASLGDTPNGLVLARMADQELGHSRFWKRYTGLDAAPRRVKVWFYYLLARLLGITFAIKLMERRERDAIRTYRELSGRIADIEAIISDEERHEMEVLQLLDEDRLKYVGSIVLGLNDALVEFTGSLAGFTFALQDTRVIAAVGSIMGVAAALSMGASEYLSQKSDRSGSEPVRSALYTGSTYIVTVLVLVTPFLLLSDPFLSLAFTLLFAIGIIVCFTFYTSVAGDLPFLKRFAEMAALSLGIAGISFLIGLLIRGIFHVEV